MAGLISMLEGTCVRLKWCPMQPSSHLLGHLCCCTLGNNIFAVCSSATSFSRNPRLNNSRIGTLANLGKASLSYSISSIACTPTTILAEYTGCAHFGRHFSFFFVAMVGRVKFVPFCCCWLVNWSLLCHDLAPVNVSTRCTI